MVSADDNDIISAEAFRPTRPPAAACSSVATRAGHDPPGRRCSDIGTADDDRSSLRARAHARTHDGNTDARTRGRISGRTNGRRRRRRRIPFVFAVRVLESLTRSSSPASARVSACACVGVLYRCTGPPVRPSVCVGVRARCACECECVRA